MLTKLTKYIFGFVVFTAKGGFVERFINICAVRRISIWDVQLNHNVIKASISVRDFKKLRSVARKTGVNISLCDKCGLPFYIRAHSDRVGLFIGVCIFVFFMTVMNTRVWCIHTVGSDKISREQMLIAADKAGLDYGIKVKNFDEEKAAREIYKSFNGELSWIKVNIKGSLAVIDFRDKVKKLEIDEKGEP
jgi:similar to stage IV sporulation protein